MRLGRAELPSHRERPYLVTNDDNPPEQLLLRWRIQADPPATRWTSGGTVLPRNSYLAAGDSLTSGAYRLVMQGDGNLVLYGGAAIWVTDTDNQCPGPEARMQPDGNVVLYCAGVAKQATGTDGHPGAALSLHPDRHLGPHRGGLRLLRQVDHLTAHPQRRLYQQC